MNLKQLIKKGKFKYVNTEIDEKNFPSQEVSKDFKLFHFDREISSENATEEIEKEGYRPANLYELLTYAEKEWDGKMYVVALGSVWRRLGGRGVPILWYDSSGRGLRLDWFECGWILDYRFLAVRKPGTGNLGGSEIAEHPDIEFRIKKLEKDMEKLKKIINL